MGPIRLESPQREPLLEDFDLTHSAQALHDFSKHSVPRRIFIGSILAWIIAFICLQNTLWSDPQSLFFNSGKAYEYHYTNRRLEVSNAYLAAANNVTGDVSTTSPSSNQPVICAGMVTVKRKEIQYLNATVGSMLVGLIPEERSSINVRLLFANLDASIHLDWNEPWLRSTDWWGGYDLTDAELDHVRRLKAKTIQAEGLFDYAYILEECYNNTKAPYIAVVEDDLIFADGWLAKAFEALARVRQQSFPWLYLRLFYTESQIGWDKAVDAWYTNPIFRYVFALVSCFLAAALTKLHCMRLPSEPELHRRCASMALFFRLILPAFIPLIFMSGSNLLMPLNGVVRMGAKGCCTQALIYPREQVPALTEMLRQTEAGPSDMIIEKWANGAGIARYAVAPSVVQHVGIVSTRGMSKKFAQQTFAYRFEAQSPETLRRHHESLSRWGIWRAEVFDDT